MDNFIQITIFVQPSLELVPLFRAMRERSICRLHHTAGMSLRAGGRRFPPGYYECGPRLSLMENKGKLKPKETPRCLIPRLLVVFTHQLEILTTTLTHT